MKYKFFIGIGIIVAVVALIIVVEIIMIKYNGKPVAAPNIPRGPETFGTGRPLTFVVLGDSTSIGQGSGYDDGIARNSARYIAAKGYAVTMQNYGVSGAVAREVLTEQLPRAARLTPDVVLIAVGANDVTHFTPPAKTRDSLEQTIRQLQAANPKVTIVLTGSPQMGSIPRFPQPIRYLAGVRTGELNKTLANLQQSTVVLAPLAADTGKLFSEHTELFAEDNFHPTAAGYRSWMPTLQRAYDKVLAQQ